MKGCKREVMHKDRVRNSHVRGSPYLCPFKVLIFCNFFSTKQLYCDCLGGIVACGSHFKATTALRVSGSVMSGKHL